MLKLRLITGPLLIVLLLGIVALDEYVDTIALPESWQQFFNMSHAPRGIVLFGVSLIIAPLAGVELSRVIAANNILSRPWLTAFAAIIGLLVSYTIPLALSVIDAVAVVSTGLIVVLVAALLTFSRQKNVQGVLAAAGAVVVAFVYIGLMLGFFLAIRREHSAWLIVGIVLTTKSSDIGAYFTGRAIGRHKLIPWLSPGKTWEGLFGGVAFATLIGLLMAALSARLPAHDDQVPLLAGAIFGALFALVGQFGDLTMSLLKRGGGLKDSSNILPGMGGVLDVLDSPLMVAPAAYWLLALLS